MEISNVYYLNELGGKKNQEDYIWPVPPTGTEARIYIVCDGVGGAERGEEASRIVSESVGAALLKMPAESVNVTYINQLLNDAQVKMIKYANSLGGVQEMATTFSLILITDDKVFVCWCGDSRIYHIRDKQILFKSDDHSLVHSLVKVGEITEEEARRHPQKNIILKAIRADDSQAEAEGQWISDIADGDYFMACTDGLLENISERDLQFLLEQNDKGKIDLVPSFQQFCRDKTKDNYSMYLVKVRMRKPPVSRRRILTYLGLLLLVLAAGVFLLLVKDGFFVQRTGQALMPARDSPAAMMPARDTAAPVKDTVVFVEKSATASDSTRSKDTTKH
jgi:PPM family protein phosphatase